MSDEVRCLCWNCGREILSDETIYEVNEELWCEDCAAPLGNAVNLNCEERKEIENG